MNTWTNLNEALSLLPILNDLTDLKQELDSLKPLSQEVEGRVMQKIRLEWNYHSNAIEGNKLTYGETYSFLMYGLTAKGKPLKDHLDIRGHNEAISFLTSLVKDSRDLTEADIRDLHKMILVEPYSTAAQTPDGQQTSKTILLGEYKKMPNHVKTPTGEIHYYATPEDVPVLMRQLVDWYNEAQQNEAIHPSVLAAFFHHRFVAIHPFDDGNGRLGRILMNLILMKKGYPPAIIKLKERTDYYAALNQADKNEYQALIEFIAEAVSDSINIYLKASKGESIEEDGDIDKEIALFKASFEKTYVFRSKKNDKKVIENFYFKVFDNALIKLAQFDELFESYDRYMHIGIISNIVSGGGDVRNKILFIDKFNEGYSYIKDNKEVNNRPMLSIIARWNNFNKQALPFNISSVFKLFFKKSYFQIFIEMEYFRDKGVLIMTKDYSDNITENEIDEVVNTWVKMIFESIKKNIRID